MQLKQISNVFDFSLAIVEGIRFCLPSDYDVHLHQNYFSSCTNEKFSVTVNLK